MNIDILFLNLRLIERKQITNMAFIKMIISYVLKLKKDI
jgi:hypothetical protein